MKMKFQCELLTDVILNTKSASEGNNETLDFIPGNNFLGIVANALYKSSDTHTLNLFHNGKVRFGDAHPAMKNGDSIERSFKIPLVMFHPKLVGPDKECYISYYHSDKNDADDKQLKQCRNGFYALVNDKLNQLETRKAFAIKSSYDRDARRSKDQAMFGYEALVKGSVFCFDVESDDEVLLNEVSSVLVGNDGIGSIQHLGRSRTAQYGEIRITASTFSEIESRGPIGNYVTVYADGRLIFLDENGLPTFQPSSEQLGLPKDMAIDWDKCQIRTFQYSPWNSKRQSFDADRCGIEKGSVFVIKKSDFPTNFKWESRYVGSYNNEGFGKVIYNPLFLDISDTTQNGEAKYLTCKNEKINNDQPDNHSAIIQNEDSALVKCLKYRYNTDLFDRKTTERVNYFVSAAKRSEIYKDISASQWGSIRAYAYSCTSKDDLINKLFDRPNGYLVHGIAQSSWDKQRRREILKTFIEGLDEETTIDTVVNLSSEMQKLS